MPEAGFTQTRRISPTGLTIVIVIHAAAITALAMSKMDAPVMKVFTPLQIKDVVVPPEPDPVPPEPQPEAKPLPRTEITYVPPIIPPMTPPRADIPAVPTIDPPVFDAGPVGETIVPTPPRGDPAPSDPVRVEARLRTGDPQPPYPASEQRAGREGSVRVRITIAPTGRVTAVEKLSASSDAFFQATERYALRAWRFAPATVDGKAVESVKVMTVHFRLDS